MNVNLTASLKSLPKNVQVKAITLKDAWECFEILDHKIENTLIKPIKDINTNIFYADINVITKCIICMTCCNMWQVTSIISYMLINLDATEFLLPMIAFVLSTLRLTQLFHGIFSDSEHCSTATKITDALAASSPSVRHILKKWLVTLLKCWM